MNSYGENEMRKVGAKVLSCADFASAQRLFAQMTNSAHDTGVVSEWKKGNCTKELDVQFSSSNSSDETERTPEE